MEELEKIKAWLESENKDYNEGVQLLSLHTKNRVLINTLSRKENNWNREKLIYELSKLVADLPTEEAGQGEANPKKSNVILVVGENHEAIIKQIAEATGQQVELIKLALEDLLKGDFERVKEMGLIVQEIDSKLFVKAGGFSHFFLKNDELIAQILLFLQAVLEKIANESPSLEKPTKAAEHFEDVYPKIPTPEAEQKVEGLAPAKSSALEEIVAEQSRIYTEKAQLSNTLADLGDSNEEISRAQRKMVVDQILALEEKYNALAEKKKLIEAGQVPAEPAVEAAPEKTLDKSELLQRRNNLRSNLTKAKNALAAKPDDVNKQVKVAKLSAELEELEIQLKLRSSCSFIPPSC